MKPTFSLAVDGSASNKWVIIETWPRDNYSRIIGRLQSIEKELALKIVKLLNDNLTIADFE